jgi:hypothetical protein
MKPHETRVIFLENITIIERIFKNDTARFLPNPRWNQRPSG